MIQNYLQVGDDSLRMEVIHEEDESNAAKMSFQQLDALRFELTANPEHDCKLLRKALQKLQQSIQLKAINRQLARIQYEQLKEKLDKFFSQKIEITTETQLETISFLCNDINQLLQLIYENYEDQSEVFADSRYDLSSSQIEVIMKKKSSEQLSQIRKKSYAKVSQSNIYTEPDQQVQAQPNSHRRNQSISSQSIGSQNNNNNNAGINPQSNMNQINAKYTQSRFQSCENLSQAAQNGAGQGNQMSPEQHQMKASIDKQDQDRQNIDQSDNLAASSTFIQSEDVIINKPKSIEIKQNSFNLFKGQAQQPPALALIIDSPKNNIVTPKQIQIMPTTIQINENLSNSKDRQNLENTALKQTALTPETNTKQQDTLQVNEEKTSFLSKQSINNQKQNTGMQLLTLQEQDLQLKSTNGPEEDDEDGYYREHIKSFQSSTTQKQDAKQEEKNVKAIEINLEQDFEKIKQLFDDKYVDEVEEERVKLYQKIEELKNKNPQQVELLQMIYNFEKKIQKDLKYYKDIYDQLILTTNYIKEKEGWQQEKNKGGIGIQYKKIPNSKLLALRLECEDMEMSIKVLISIVYEIELYSLWFPFCKIGKNLKTVDKACKVVYLKMDVPFISDREVYIHGLGVNRLYRDGSIVIMARTIDKDIECQKETGVEVPPSSKCVRVDIPFFTFVFKPISENKLQLYAVCNLDAHLKLVPDSMINLVLRKFAFFLFDKMIEQNKKFKGSKWEQNMKNNPDFYEWIEREYKKFFIQNPHLAQKLEMTKSASKESKHTKKK